MGDGFCSCSIFGRGLAGGARQKRKLSRPESYVSGLATEFWTTGRDTETRRQLAFCHPLVLVLRAGS
jgi:hypothetical protein